jgi:hypothetical protein
LFQENYQNLNFLVCPTDAARGVPMTDTTSLTLADRSPRSYLINGWNDYFWRQTGNPDPNTYNGMRIKENAILKPTDTILFGEKKNLETTPPAEPAGADYLHGSARRGWGTMLTKSSGVVIPRCGLAR